MYRLAPNWTSSWRFNVCRVRTPIVFSKQPDDWFPEDNAVSVPLNDDDFVTALDVGKDADGVEYLRVRSRDWRTLRMNSDNRTFWEEA